MQTLAPVRRPKPKAVPGSPSQQSLVQAFASFAQAAGSLERSYTQLQSEVLRLRRELESTNHDLSRSLEENQRMRTYLGSILEGLPCGVLVVDAEGILRLVNPEARRLLSLDSNLVPDGVTSLPQTLMQSLWKTADDPSLAEQEWAQQRARGTREVGLKHALLPARGDSPSEEIYILRDKTDEKRLEEERMAVRKTQALADMAMLLAHEIRNPLGSLELFAGLLAGAAEIRPATREWVDHLQAGLRALSATVNNVLNFHSHPALQRVPTDVVRLLRETVDFLRPMARQRQMQIDFESFAAECLLPADPHRLQQVFLNLALNAFRAMVPGGGLKIHAGLTTDSAPRAQVDFEDEGCGIAPENLERIFNPGFTTTPGSPGLGLAASRKIIEQHGGKIKVQSAIGKGSTFTLILPVLGAMA